jgi:hypothetical protein
MYWTLLLIVQTIYLFCKTLNSKGLKKEKESSLEKIEKGKEQQRKMGFFFGRKKRKKKKHIRYWVSPIKAVLLSIRPVNFSGSETRVEF